MVILVSLISFSGCGSKTPEQVVENYLKAKDWQERLKYVLEPDRVKPVMEKRYSTNYTPPDKIKVNPVKPIKDQWFEVEAILNGDRISYYLQKTENGYKIDWESSVGYNAPMTVAAFKAQRPKEPMKFRVIGNLSNSYPYIPWEIRREAEKNLWSVGLRDGDGNSIAYGYIEKESDDGKRLYELLKDGEKHKFTAIIKFFEGSRPGDDAVIIEKFVCDGWLDK